MANQVEFAGSDRVLRDTEYAAQPDLQAVPALAAAVVAVYNIKLLPESASTATEPTVPGLVPGVALNARLVLDGGLAADLFEGRILQWDDPRIQAANPHIAHRLPATPVVRAVRSGSSGTTSIFASYVAAASRSFEEVAVEAEGGSLSLPLWPEGLVTFNRTAATRLIVNGTAIGPPAGSVVPAVDRVPQPTSPLVGGRGTSGVADVVVAAEGCIGYVVADEATERGMTSAVMRNLAGRVVDHTSDAVTFTLMERGARFDERLTASLLGAESSFAWPLAGYTYIVWAMKRSRLLRAEAVRRGYRDTIAGEAALAAALRASGGDEAELLRTLCRPRLEAARFWLWYYSTPAIDAAMRIRGFVPASPFVKEQVVSRLRDGLRCGGDRVFAAQESGSLVGLGSSVVRDYVNLMRIGKGVDSPTEPLLAPLEDVVQVQVRQSRRLDAVVNRVVTPRSDIRMKPGINKGMKVRPFIP